MKNTTSPPFYPAREQKFVIQFFTLYSELLLRLRFKNVFINRNEVPDQPILIYSNHSYWWDALVPLVLNKRIFKRKARAIMEDKQMTKYPFFSKIGAFSVNLDGYNLRNTLSEATNWLNQKSNLLFIYPQGKMVQPDGAQISFKNGLSWILKQSKANAIPVAYYISYHKYSKPELFISVGQAHDNSFSTQSLESSLEKELQKCIDAAFQDNSKFDSLF